MLIVANWKAYVDDLEKAKKLFSISKKLAIKTSNNIILAPPAPLLGALSANNKSKVSFAAQDISASAGGALTGEITAGAYVAAGATYAIIGHSERRAVGDTNNSVAEKIARAFANNLIPILCVGEKERDKDGRYLSYIREEITTAISFLSQKERSKVIVAYEPIWAIGKTAAFSIKSDDLAEMALYIRKVLMELIPGKNSSHSIILYGGSVETENINALSDSNINGFLIGHASVDPGTFTSLAKQISGK